MSSRNEAIKRHYAVEACWRKKRHEHALSALHHAAHLHRLIPLAKPVVYECLICEGLHVTSGKAHKRRDRLNNSLANIRRIMGDDRFWKQAPLDVQHKYQRLEHLLSEELGK